MRRVANRLVLFLEKRFGDRNTRRPARDVPTITAVLSLETATLEPRTRAYAGGFRTVVRASDTTTRRA